jgi:glycosyltransferase involved in cell wall biosynthesis
LNILHLANDYSGSEVYKNLVMKLDDLDLIQTVYTAIRNPLLIGKNRVAFKHEESTIIYSYILSKYIDRIFLHKKINKIIQDIEFKIDIENVDFIHAHTWYSDGGVAYKLHKKYNIPYLVTIRNSDLNFFQKYLIHERSFGRKILLNAQKVILISASYKKRLIQQKSLQVIKDELLNKLELIPNGVDDFWIENPVNLRKSITKPTQVLFVGKFMKGKNVFELQKAVQKLNAEDVRVQLHLIGGDGEAEKVVLDIVESNPRTMFYHGKIFDNLKLKTYFERAHVFALPSKRETFGLVYVEAMLQGLPLLYTANEGIDGLYSENIGEKVHSSKVEEIKCQLLRIIQNYDSYSIPTNKLLENHNWRYIAKVYQLIYKNLK